MDLRNINPDKFLEQLKQAMGQDGLLTYRYLGRKTVNMHGADRDSMKLRPDMRLPSGALMAAPLAIATAETGGFTDFNSVPAPITADLSFLEPFTDIAEIEIKPDVVRTGRTMGFSRSVVIDAAAPERVLAMTAGVGIKLAAAPEDTGERLPFQDEIAERSDLPPLHEVFGVFRRKDGLWGLPELQPGNISTSGSLHLGPIHILMDRAGLDAVEAHSGRAVSQMLGWNVMFVSAGTKGPFKATCNPQSGRGDGRALCEITLVDEGRDRTVAVARGQYLLE